MSTNKDLENYDKLYYGSLLGPERPFNPSYVLSELGMKTLAKIEIPIAEDLVIEESIIRNRELVVKDFRKERDITPVIDVPLLVERKDRE